jgi:alkylated DNA repair dioxygenase AlkB
MNYAGDYAQQQGINKRGANFVDDAYFNMTIQVSNMVDLSYLEDSRKIDIEMSINSNKVVLFPYAGLADTDVSKKQYDYFMEGSPELVNEDLIVNDTAYVNSSDELTDPKQITELSKKYIKYLNGLNHGYNLTFNIESKPGVNDNVIAHLESLGYKKHPMLSDKGIYFAMSKQQSMSVNGLYNTNSSFTIKEDNILHQDFKNELIKAPVSQLVSKQLANKFNKNDEYEVEKNKSTPNWNEFIKTNFADNTSIELAYKYVVSQIVKKDAKFKAMLINTSDAVLLSENISDKLNNMYSRALMDARKGYVTVNAIPVTNKVEKRALLTTSSGFLSAGTLPGFVKVDKITGAEIYDGEVFNRVEADALFNRLNVEFPKVLSIPSQRDANFANTKSIYFGPIEYNYASITKAPAEFPSWLDKTVRELEKRMGVIPGYFDTALINRYETTEQGLGMHTDAEPNLVGKEKINPTVLTLSLGAERVFKFEGLGKFSNEKIGIPTKHGHVLVMGKDSQFNYKHGIERNSGQNGTRYSITLRHTPDVNPVGRSVEKSASIIQSFERKNLFNVTPTQAADKKAKIKASIATQYIGFGEGISGSSTELYRQQAGDFANTGNYSSNDIIFVSIPGKRGSVEIAKREQDKTIKEAIKAVEAGATILTDNKAYTDASSYNTGEKRLYANMETKGYNYSEITVDGQLIGTWSKSKQSIAFKTEIVERYTDAEVKANPDKIYVFGDNLQRTGTGGQAQIRNNPNAFGIVTKLKPTMNADAFMSDSDIDMNRQNIDADIRKIKAENKVVVFPKDGLGTGLAKLKEKAPQTFAYLSERLQKEFGFNNEGSEITGDTKSRFDNGKLGC